jgi:hypothetical protein
MTSHCVIPGCDRPSETHMCAGCWGALRAQLVESSWLAAELELTRTRGDKPGSASIGFVTRSPESAMVFREHASEVADRLRNIMASWVRDLWETHAVRWEECGKCGAQWFGGDKAHTLEDCAGTWAQVMDTLTVAFSTPALALWLLRHQTWIQIHPAAEELHDELLGAYADAWHAIDRHPGRMYVGICSADTKDAEGAVIGPCEKDLFTTDLGRPVVCPECGTEHSPGARREILTSALQHQYVQPGVLVGIVDRLGRELNMAMVRGYRRRSQIMAYVYDENAKKDPYGFRVRPYDPDTDEGFTLLYRVGDVLDAMDRRYQRQAKEAS